MSQMCPKMRHGTSTKPEATRLCCTGGASRIDDKSPVMEIENWLAVAVGLFMMATPISSKDSPIAHPPPSFFLKIWGNKWARIYYVALGVGVFSFGAFRIAAYLYSVASG